MTDDPITPSMAKPYAEEVSPDSLMNDFRGRSIVAIVALSLIFQVLFIGIFSVGYLKNQLLGEDKSSLSGEERMDVAVREATSSLREIAERHGVSAEELSERFSAGGSARESTSTAQPANSDPQGAPTGSAEQMPEKPLSGIEQELRENKDGPELPELPSIDDEDDLF